MNNGELIKAPIEDIVPNRYQPRQDFNADALEDLAENFRANGIIQPIVGRAHPTQKGKLEIAVGERRWRAAGLAQLSEVPFLLRQLTDQQMAEFAIIENTKREDLNPIDEALAFRRLKEEFGYKSREIAALGPEEAHRSESYVSHSLRLLSLEPRVQGYLREGELSRGHGKALTTLSGPVQVELATRAVLTQMSVRQLEAAIKKLIEGKQDKKKLDPEGYSDDPNIRRLEQEYTERLGSPLRLSSKKDKWKIEIECSSLDELNGVLEHIK